MTQDFVATSEAAGKPAALFTPARPLNQEGRILAALGLTHGLLPRVATEWLVRYHDYLAARLLLPFEARCPENTGVLRPWTSTLTVVALVPPAGRLGDDGSGLRCSAIRGTETTEIPLFELEVPRDHPNAQLIEDYWYWFWNWQFDPKI